MLRTHEECHQKAMLKRAGRSLKIQDIRVFFPGTVVDRVMREYLDNVDRRPGEMAARVQEVMDREEVAARENGDGIVKWKSQQDRKEVYDKCIKCVTILEPILDRIVLPHEYEPAKRFRVPLTIPGLDGSPQVITLNGEMDLLMRVRNKDWAVLDLKMTADDSYWRKTIMQLVFYDLAVRLAFGEYSTFLALIQPLCKIPIVPIEPTDDLRAQMYTRILNMAHDIWRKQDEPKASAVGCNRCEVSHACIRFKPVNGRVQLSAAAKRAYR
jgi:hypothetical protein